MERKDGSREMLEDLAGIVTRAGRRLMALREEGLTGGSWEGTQFKSRADTIAHSLIAGELGDLHPGIPVVSEEDPASWRGVNPGRYFLVDPIDGTASLAGGFPGFVTQVALMEGHRPTLAAIRAPALGALYTATLGGGAHLDGRLLRIADPGRWESLIDNYPEPRGIARDACRELGFSRYIESGSISLKICRVADGTADLFLKDVPVRNWDIAPAHLVLGEAGGVLMDLGGGEVAYDRGMDHRGLVAAKSIAHAERILSWYTERRKGGGGG